jgi:hypothetical protein
MDLRDGLAMPLEDHRLAALFHGSHERREICFRIVNIDVDHVS